MTDALVKTLRGIVGERHVLTGEADRAPYETEPTGRYHGRAAAVVRPADTEEVAGVVRAAATRGAAIIPQGGNTGLTGATIPGAGRPAVILSLARLNRIESVDRATRTATAGAGVVLQALHEAAEAEGLVFPLFFGARGSAMLGGAISTNAGGSNVLRYGPARALVLGLEAVTPEGRVMNLMSRLVKDNTGYDLKDLFIGAEGTLGVITRAVVRLYPRPRAYATALLAMEDFEPALGLLNDLQDLTGGAVEAFEFMPPGHLADYAARYPERKLPLGTPGPVNILLEIGADSALLADPDDTGRAAVHGLLEDRLARELGSGRVRDAVIAQSETQRAALWHIRECAHELTVMHGPGIDHDIALPLDRVGEFIVSMEARLPELAPGARVALVGHLGDGNLHYTVIPEGNREGMDPALATRVTESVEDEVARLGGSFSAEHGIGQSKRGTMARRKDSSALDAMRAVKTALDPNGIMNPGKLLP